MRSLLKDKKGVMGMGIAKNFLLSLLSLVIIGVVALIVLISLNSASVGTAYSGSTSTIINNATAAIASFYQNISIWLSLLGVVIIILIVAVVLVVVNKFGGEAGSEGL